MKKHYLLLVVILLIHLFLLITTEFTAWPEMLSYPYLKNNGFLLYKDMVHPYPPILTLLLAYLYKLFGYKLEVLKGVTYLIILVNDVLIYLIVKKLTKSLEFALTSLAVYAFLQPFFEGNMLWFDLAIVPPILLSIYFFFSERTVRNIFLSGLFLGIATFTKQTAGLFLFVIPACYFLQRVNIKKIVWFFLGPSIIFGILAIRLETENAFFEFFQATLINPVLYWNGFPGYVQMNLNRWQIFALALLFLPLLLVFWRKFKNQTSNATSLLLFLGVSFILVYPRFSFFHLQIGIAVTIITSFYFAFIKKVAPKLLLFYYIVVVCVVVKPWTINFGPGESRFWRSKELSQAREIIKFVNTGKSVYLLGPSSSYYVFIDRLPVKPWSDNFGWYYEVPNFDEKIIESWSKVSPDYIVWKEPSKKGNWYDLDVFQPKEIITWILGNYKIIGTLDEDINVWKKI